VAAHQDGTFESHPLLHHRHHPGFNVVPAEIQLAAVALGEKLGAAYVYPAEVLPVERQDNLFIDKVYSQIFPFGDAVLAVAHFLALRPNDPVAIAEWPAAVNAHRVGRVAAFKKSTLDLTASVCPGAHYPI
jgi:hypothetical protein